MTAPLSSTPVMASRSDAVTAWLDDVDGRTVVRLRLDGGKHRGAVGPAEGEVFERAVRLAVELGVPFTATVATSGADVSEGVASLHAWGRVARALTDASGVVPVVMAVVGPAVSGPALLLGLADAVVMTRESFAYVSGPATVAAFTGVQVDHVGLGGAAVHHRTSGVASIVVGDEDAVDDAVADVLAYLPANHLAEPPRVDEPDPLDRACAVAADAVPARPNASYDVRTVVEDVLDDGSVLELRSGYAPNVVTALARLGGRPVGVVANQPHQRAGTLDIEASRKAARHVAWCDAFNLPILTFVDTPGFEPGRDLEWRGMIRHGAQLVHAYAAATVPRLCVVLRKAYGGAYIVMDSKGIGNDWCIAWPTAEIAVMGAAPAVQIVHRRELGARRGDERVRVQRALEEEYEGRFSNPYRAAERGYVDAVVHPLDTRAALADALDRLATKRERGHRGRHRNTPL